MSPTILETVVVLILLVAAWQLGILLAPIVLRELHVMRRTLEEVSEEHARDETRETLGEGQNKAHDRKD